MRWKEGQGLLACNLEQVGPFDLVLRVVRRNEWERVFTAHRVIDPNEPDQEGAIYRLSGEMLQEWHNHKARCAYAIAMQEIDVREGHDREDAQG